MDITIYLPAKITMKRITPFRHYAGTLEIAGHEFRYSFKYEGPAEDETQKSRLKWENYNPAFSAVYKCLNPDMTQFLHKKVVDLEVKIRLIKEKFPSNLGLQASGGTSAEVKKESETSYSLQTPNNDPQDFQAEFQTNIKISSGLEKILRETPKK